MQRFTFLLMVFLLVAAGLWAQSQPPSQTNTNCDGGICPNNAFQYGQHFFPADSFINQGCAYYHDPSGHNFDVPIPNLPAQITTYTTQSTGEHSHEIRPNMGRTQAYFTASNPAIGGAGPSFGQTDANGCVNFTTQLPGIAGYYTFVISFAPVLVPSLFGGELETVTPVGFNNFAAVWSTNLAGQTSWFVSYPDNQTINVAQSLNTDTNHSLSSRWFTQSAENQIAQASTQYVGDSGENQGIIDRINVLRGSLEYGGIADNFLGSTGGNFYLPLGAANWQAIDNEWHMFGNEVDVSNPSTGSMYGLFGTLVYDMSAHGCRLGQYLPGAGRLSVANRGGFWSTQTYVHFDCSPQPTLQ